MTEKFEIGFDSEVQVGIGMKFEDGRLRMALFAKVDKTPLMFCFVFLVVVVGHRIHRIQTLVSASAHAHACDCGGERRPRQIAFGVGAAALWPMRADAR